MDDKLWAILALLIIALAVLYAGMNGNISTASATIISNIVSGILGMVAGRQILKVRNGNPEKNSRVLPGAKK